MKLILETQISQFYLLLTTYLLPKQQNPRKILGFVVLVAKGGIEPPTFGL